MTQTNNLIFVKAISLRTSTKHPYRPQIGALIFLKPVPLQVSTQSHYMPQLSFFKGLNPAPLHVSYQQIYMHQTNIRTCLIPMPLQASTQPYGLPQPSALSSTVRLISCGWMSNSLTFNQTLQNCCRDIRKHSETKRHLHEPSDTSCPSTVSEPGRPTISSPASHNNSFHFS